MSGAPLQYVGVFRDAPQDDIVSLATGLGLRAVQLHGNETQQTIDALRQALPPQVAIWKALSVSDSVPARNYRHVDRYVFDQGAGGTGQCFDWSLLAGQVLNNVILAGGLRPDNCAEAVKAGCAGLDFNSGVESAPGIKDSAKIAAVFATLRG